MDQYELIRQKRHEVNKQEVRHERTTEAKRLDKLKLGLQLKMAAGKARGTPVRAA